MGKECQWGEFQAGGGKVLRGQGQGRTKREHHEGKAEEVQGIHEWDEVGWRREAVGSWQLAVGPGGVGQQVAGGRGQLGDAGRLGLFINQDREGLLRVRVHMGGASVGEEAGGSSVGHAAGEGVTGWRKLKGAGTAGGLSA